LKKITYFLVLLCYWASAQHHSKLTVNIDASKKLLGVYQELTFHNQSNDTLSKIVLNDWNNAYSSKNTPLGKRFSDEFVRIFHFAPEKERGSTNNVTVLDESKFMLNWCRFDEHPDIIEIQLKDKLAPGEKANLTLTYVLKIASDRFTRLGYNSNDEMALKNCFLTPARYENKKFVLYENLNLDDCTNAFTDIDLQVVVPTGFEFTSDIPLEKRDNVIYNFSGKNILQTAFYLERKSTFASYKNSLITVQSNLQDNKLDEIKRAIIIDKIVNYVHEKIGYPAVQSITVSQVDYEQNPFYGLNQLPSFISPFSDDFIFELKFLKTYLNNYLKGSMYVDQRKDNWVFDAIQVYYMMRYIDENYPNAKMMGTISKLKLLRGYNLVSLDFNGQYSYFYMLMARKNLDQPLGDPKNTLIKFNERIASKYRAGLSFKYLEEFIGEQELNAAINEFIALASKEQTDDLKLRDIIQSKTDKNLDWFFNIIIDSRKTIDYKFDKVTKTGETVSFQLKNKTGVSVPIPVYGVKKRAVVFKEWINVVKEDSTYTFPRKNADKIVLNYKNEVPEFNQRNNWKSLKPFSLTNKPIKFIFLKDLEDPFYNQVVYLPTLNYNFYDGVIAGMRFNNKTILDRPINFDVNPSYSTKSQSITGSFSLALNQFRRESNLFNIRYGISGDYFHYAPDASYQRLNTSVNLRIREYDYRDNHRQSINFRNIYVNREKSEIVNSTFEGSYSVFNARYINSKTEITKHFGFLTDIQISNKFGKVAGEISYRRLFDDNRQVNLRLYAGKFLYNSTNSDFFDFALDRPTDYMFDYNYLGRSEDTGLFSQQYIIAEGGFKSRLEDPFANDWLVTTNASFNIWNWIEVYGDLGFISDKNAKERFVYDSGIRLNLVTDYFELYFPVYSNNGWEISQAQYSERIRFIATLSTNTVISLFTRKWF
jgi:hypothetical protein